jgi:hypothetical protein
MFFLRKFFRNSVAINVPQAAARYAAGVTRRRKCAAEKPRLAARKNLASRVAFGLPQDSHMQLMLEACVKRGSELSAFRGVEF